MDLGIGGRKAIVNGGSAGIGRGAALALAREGAELFIAARGRDRLEATCAAIRDQTGARVTAIVADHGTAAGRADILAECPAPDILVGTCTPPPYVENFRDVSEQDWRDNLETTFLSPVEMMKAVIDGMIDRRWGRIVNIGTAGAKFPHPLRILSGAPRAALANYSVALARQVAQHNIAINTVLPAMHDTDGIRAIYAPQAERKGITLDEEFENVVRAIPIPAGRFGNADDLGAIVAMLCSEQANYIVGQSLTVDGGVTNMIF